MFCPNCGSLMKPKKEEWTCKKCGFTRDVEEEDHDLITSKKEEKETIIIENEISTLPTTKARCPECGHNEAYWRMEQTRAADEPETRIYRCTSCNSTWREY
ncbi:MAG: transcription factor S [Thermoplasmatota archaeon]